MTAKTVLDINSGMTFDQLVATVGRPLWMMREDTVRDANGNLMFRQVPIQNPLNGKVTLGYSNKIWAASYPTFIVHLDSGRVVSLLVQRCDVSDCHPVYPLAEESGSLERSRAKREVALPELQRVLGQ